MHPSDAAALAKLRLGSSLDLRHLPGKHDQSTHGGGGGKAPAGAQGGAAQSYDSPEASREFINDHYGQWRKGLTDAEYSGLSFYQSPGFHLMNEPLRGRPVAETDKKVLARAQAATKGLKSAIAKAPPLKQAVTVHRGFSVRALTGTGAGGEIKPGMRVTDRAFVSTSLTSKGVAAVGQASRPAVARITLPKGTRAAAGSSRELILAPDSSFVVTAVSTRGGVTHVDMELVL